MGVIADKIRRAIFGGEVRDSIADGIELVERLREDYDNQVINAGNSNAEIVDARGGQTKLKVRLDNFDEQLDTIKIEKLPTLAPIPYVDNAISQINNSPRGVFANLATLQSTYPNGASGVYLTEDTGHWYYWKIGVYEWTDGGLYQSNGINKDSVTEEKLARNSVNFFKHTKEVPIVFKNKPINLFNKNNVTQGYYVAGSTGVLTVNVNYTASEFIPVEAGLPYWLTKVDQGAWYDGDKKFLTKITPYDTNPMIAPTNAKWVRFSTLKTNLEAQMLCQSSTQKEYEPYYTDLKLNAKDYLKENSVDETLLSNNIANKLTKISTKEIMSSLFDIATKTKIKLLGDSVTSGEGSTNRTYTSTLVPGTTDKYVANAPNSWAGLLQTLVSSRFNREIVLSATNSNIKYFVDYAYSNAYDGATVLTNYFLGGGIRKAIQLDFYSDKLKIAYSTGTNIGKVDVYIDGEKKGTIDGYSTIFGNGVYELDLSLGKHKLEVYETATKNDSSSSYKFYLQNITLKKYASVTNYGISGYRTDNTLLIADSVIESDDDIVIIQLGTNDRNANEIYAFKRHIRKMIRLGLSKNPNMKFILMSANPLPSVSDNAMRYYGMFELDRAVKELALEFNLICGHVSNYMGIMNYMEYTDVELDSLLADGLHPNDKGYKVMFRNMCKEFGIPYLVDGVTK